jgi:hypothetical protein
MLVPPVGLYPDADKPLAARGIEIRCTAGLSNRLSNNSSALVPLRRNYGKQNAR